MKLSNSLGFIELTILSLILSEIIFPSESVNPFIASSINIERLDKLRITPIALFRPA